MYSKILQDICFTCKYYDGSMCNRLNFKTYELYVCDAFKRKNSGAFRRKRRKAKEKLKNYII